MLNLPKIRINLPKISYLRFWLILSAIYALVFVGIEFMGSPANGIKGYLVLASQWAVVSLSASMVIGLIGLNKWVFMILWPVLLTLSAIAAYYRLTMGLSITANLIDLALTNEWSTWVTVITLPLVIGLIASLAASVLIVIYRFRKVERAKHVYVLTAIYFTGCLLPVHIVTRFKAPVTARMPYSFWYSVNDWLANRRAVAENRDTYSRVNAVAHDSSPDVIFIIGESLRSDHLQLNGYNRATTPLLAADTAVISFPEMWSDHIYTHISVPHIMTRADSIREDAAFSDESFISLFRKAGYKTYWLSNQDGVATYAYFMHEADSLIMCNSARNLYGFDKWTDYDLLAPLDHIINKGKEEKRLAVLHTIGSHWWYPAHYTDSFARFRPEVDSRILSELSQEQMVNSYDNTILATDAFIAEIIKKLQKRNAIIIFISDHGESLGEEGRYLHASDHETLHHPACFVWYSPQYAANFPEKVAALKANRDKRLTTETMFHSVLDGAAIETSPLNREKSIFYFSDN